jgi:hypothetical protein
LKITQNTKENGYKDVISDKARADRFGLMDPCTKVGGKTIKPTEKEDLFMLTEMCMMANGWKTKHTDLVYTVISMVPSMKAIGRRINSMEMGWRHGQTVQNMKANMFKAKNTEPADSLGLTEVLIMDNSSKIIFKEKGNIIGLMAENTMVFGLITKWKVTEYLPGLMVVATKETMSTTKKKAKVYFSGQMEGNMKVGGRMVNNTELEPIPAQAEKLSKVNGKMGKDFNGCLLNDISKIQN